MANPSACDAARDLAYCAAYREWFDALDPAEQRRLAKLGLDKPEGNHHSGSGIGMIEDAAMRNEASEWCDPISAIEVPVVDFERELDDAFSRSLAWTTQGRTLVEIGQRLAVVLHFWMPALLAGLGIELQRECAAAFLQEMADPLSRESGGMDGLGPFLEWLSRGTSLSQWGQRVLAAVYVLRPGLIESPTLEAIGALNNKTRQAVDKLVQDFRDTFGGIKSRAMRPEENRKRCKRAQLQRTSRV